jgi:hypothetical protein
MSEQFTPEEEEHPLDWLKESSHLTNNHLSHFSDLSKDHFLDDLLKPQPTQGPFSPHQRQRGKANSKNYRERKKNNLEHIRKQVDYLQRENEYLKTQKYCKWCQRPYAPPVLLEQQKLDRPQTQIGPSFFSKEETFELEPEF